MQGYEPWVGTSSKVNITNARKVFAEAGRNKRHWYPPWEAITHNERIPNKMVLFKAKPGVYVLLLSPRIPSMPSQIMAQARPSKPGTVEAHVLSGARTERSPVLVLSHFHPGFCQVCDGFHHVPGSPGKAHLSCAAYIWVEKRVHGPYVLRPKPPGTGLEWTADTHVWQRVDPGWVQHPQHYTDRARQPLPEVPLN